MKYQNKFIYACLLIIFYCVFGAQGLCENSTSDISSITDFAMNEQSKYFEVIKSDEMANLFCIDSTYTDIYESLLSEANGIQHRSYIMQSNSLLLDNNTLAVNRLPMSLLPTYSIERMYVVTSTSIGRIAALPVRYTGIYNTLETRDSTPNIIYYITIYQDHIPQIVTVFAKTDQNTYLVYTTFVFKYFEPGQYVPYYFTQEILDSFGYTNNGEALFDVFEVLN